MNILKVIPETILDGDGIRYAIYLAGCTHHCPGCHNPESHSPTAGTPLTEEYLQEIIDEINDNPLLDGVTLSGGDPFYNPDELLHFLQRLKAETHQEIWCYTGYTLEQLRTDPLRAPLLDYIDVLVDGRFVQALYDPQLPFRGSSNQRIIRLILGRMDEAQGAEGVTCLNGA